MRSYRIILNLISNILMQLCAIMVGIIIPQIILNQFGSEINGITSSINQFLGYFSLIEGGIGAASVIALYKPFADKDLQQIKGIYQSTLIYLNKAGIIYLILLILLAFIYPIVVLSNVNLMIIRSLILLVGIGKLIELAILGRYRIILTASQNIGLYACVQTCGYICTVIFIFLLINLNYGIVEIQGSIILVYLLKALVLKKICKSIFGEIMCNDVKRDKNLHVIPQQKSALVHQLASMLAYNTDMIVLTFAVSLTQVSVYSVYATLFNGLQSLLSAFQNVITPAFGDMISRNENSNLKKTFSLYTFLYYILISTLTICVILFIEPFIILYTRNVNDFQYWDPKIAILFIIIFILNNFRLPGSVLISAAGHLRQTQYFFAFEAVLNLLISIILVKPLGIAGCLIGTLFSGICRLLYVICYPLKKIHRFEMKVLIKRSVYNCCLILAAWNARILFINKIYSWAEFFSYALLCLCIVLIIQLLIAWLFDKEELKTIIIKLRLIIERRGKK